VAGLVVVRTYWSEIEAELARAALEAHGVEAFVRRDDAAGLLRAVTGVKLLVAPEERLLAEAILDAPPPAGGA
jgi:hypothetical protein